MNFAPDTATTITATTNNENSVTLFGGIPAAVILPVGFLLSYYAAAVGVTLLRWRRRPTPAEDLARGCEPL
jgi:hypothetical protein